MREKLDLPAALDGDLWLYRQLGRANAMHRHVELEFNLVTQGAGRYLLTHRQYDIRRGDLLWLFPAQEHVLIEQSLNFEMWVGVFKPQAVRRLATEPSAAILRQRNSSGEHCRRIAQHNLVRLEQLFTEIAGQRELPALFNAGLGYALLRAWQESQGAHDLPVRDVHPAVEKAARLLRDDATLGLDDLARLAGLSAARLSRLFKQQTGVALVDFRSRQRIERFLELYGAGQRRKMLDAALEAGFGSYPQFHRVFRRVIGCSPGRYRQR